MTLFQVLQQATKRRNAAADAMHAFPGGWRAAEVEAGDVYREYRAALHASSVAHVAVDNARNAYLNTLPPIPKGYYIANCIDPENGCIGWHCYRHGAWGKTYDKPLLEGYCPTGEFYCCGGDGEFTQQWLDGTLEPFDSLEGQ